MLEDICRGLFRHGFKKIAMLNCHGGNTPIIQVLSRKLRSELGLAVFMINCGVFFGNQAVKDTVTPGNVWDFHGGEMETSMILAERPELVKMETAQAGIPRKFMGNRSLTVYGPITLGWVSEEWETEDGTPIGIGGDPRGATAEKGEQIYQSGGRTSRHRPERFSLSGLFLFHGKCDKMPIAERQEEENDGRRESIMEKMCRVPRP